MRRGRLQIPSHPINKQCFQVLLSKKTRVFPSAPIGIVRMPLFLVMPISSFFRQLFNTLGFESKAKYANPNCQCDCSLSNVRFLLRSLGLVDKGHGFGYISPRLRSYQSFQSFWGRGDKIVVFVFFLESDLTIRFIISHIPSWGVLGSSGT